MTLFLREKKINKRVRAKALARQREEARRVSSVAPVQSEAGQTEIEIDTSLTNADSECQKQKKSRVSAQQSRDNKKKYIHNLEA
jgi:hypothetical protein